MSKQMRLVSLNLSNFKGVRKFTLDANSANAEVFGDNAAGKTTLFDAFIWLLFDKDSQNKKDFDIKTLDADGNVLHGLEHEVEGVFLVNNKQLTLRKVYSEKWTKKRGGSVRAEFTGHTTDYFIDGVPVKKAEYNSKIDEIVNEDVFKLLTSPSYFNEQLHWQKRREILLQVCGDISDEDVIANNKALADLPGILNGRNIEDHKKVIASKRAKINDELEKIPVRIDEIHHNLPDISGLNEADINNKITHLKSLIQDKEDEATRVRNGGEIAEKQKRLREVEAEILQLKNDHRAANDNKILEKRQELYKLRGDIDALQSSISSKNRKIKDNLEAIQSYEGKQNILRDNWREVNNQVFEFSQEESCPSCGQALPQEKLNAARDKALENFNLTKSNKLEGINSEGVALKNRIEQLRADNEALGKEIAELENKLDGMQAQLDRKQEEVEKLQSSVTSIDDNPNYLKLVEEVKSIEAAIQQLQESTQSAIGLIQEEVAQLRAKLRSLEMDLSKIDQHKRSEERINELKQQERDLAAEFEKLEGELFLIEEFIRAKVSMLEEKINSKFKFARFKLFDLQVNGALVEMCETLYKGVPYGSGLNNAARINVGLDIINTLSEHHGFEAPIFIDNAEAVTQLIETRGQVIKLVVSEKDKQLRVVTEEQKIKEAV